MVRLAWFSPSQPTACWRTQPVTRQRLKPYIGCLIGNLKLDHKFGKIVSSVTTG